MYRSYKIIDRKCVEFKKENKKGDDHNTLVNIYPILIK